MTPKVKLFLVLLAVLAVVSVFSFFDILGGVRSAKLHDPIKPLLPLSEDADQDGLSDADESYWNTDFQSPDTDGDGFLDGEEIASGFDPREASSHELGDSLVDTVYGTVKTIPLEDINITDISTGLLAGAIGDGVFNRGSDPDKKEEAISLVSLSALNNFYDSAPPKLPTLAIIDGSKENQVTYLNSLARIIKEDLLDFPQRLDTALSFGNQSPYFSAKSQQFKSSFDKASLLSVPEDWADIHKSILTLLGRLKATYEGIANFETDVMKAVIALNEVNNLNLEVKSLLKTIQTKISSENLTLDDDIYQVLELIIKE